MIKACSFSILVKIYLYHRDRVVPIRKLCFLNFTRAFVCCALLAFIYGNGRPMPALPQTRDSVWRPALQSALSVNVSYNGFSDVVATANNADHGLVGLCARLLFRCMFARVQPEYLGCLPSESQKSSHVVIRWKPHVFMIAFANHVVFSGCHISIYHSLLGNSFCHVHFLVDSKGSRLFARTVF
jgi:hypothetical protein